MKNSLLTLEDLSLDEQTAVTQLKQRMIGYLGQDMFQDLSLFVRFLRARDLNINAAETMLKNHIEWRKKFQIDTILTNYTPKEVLRKYVTFDSMGIDKEGSPILYFSLGNMDTRGILKSCRKIDLTKYIIQILETNIQLMKRQSIMLGRHIDRWTMILNFQNLSFAVASHKDTLEMIANLVTMYEANYPERLKEAYFLNSSTYFSMAFSIIKMVLSERTYKKIKIFGKEGYSEALLKVIDPEVLPGFLGGARTDPDGNPLCHCAVNHGGIVPERYYIKKKENSLANKPGVEKLHVTRMSKNQLTLNIQEPGSHIEWEFETKSRDIGFSLLYKKSEFDCRIKVLIPKQRIDTNMSSETGMFKCDKMGVYIIEFDNSYSWIHQKEVYYKVTVIPKPYN